MDWTKITNDPTNPAAVTGVTNFLQGIRAPIPGNDYDAFLSGIVTGKRVLDVGFCEHVVARMDAPGWKHGMLRKCAAHVTGIDIIPELVTLCRERGFDARLCDATSDEDLGDRYDIIHMGDVIEHVESPVALLRFGRRHLSAGGKIIVRTPNPFCFDYVHTVRTAGTDISNLEHICYITPTHALELARRAGLRLDAYRTLYRGGFSLGGRFRDYVLGGHFRHAWAELTAPPEIFTTIFVYELSL